MTFGRRPAPTPRRPTYRGSGGPPAWLVFLMAIALVFGVYYLFTGVGDFLRTGGLGIQAATERAEAEASTAAEAAEADAPPDFEEDPFLSSGVSAATATETPTCQDFVVSVPSAIVRGRPNTGAAILDTRSQGDVVCVMGTEAEGAWYLIDQNPRTPRIEAGFMAESIIEPVNPTPTPTLTLSPAPTVTDMPTPTPSRTFTPAPTATPNPQATPTITPSPTPTPSRAVQNA